MDISHLEGTLEWLIRAVPLSRSDEATLAARKGLKRAVFENVESEKK